MQSTQTELKVDDFIQGKKHLDVYELDEAIVCLDRAYQNSTDSDAKTIRIELNIAKALKKFHNNDFKQAVLIYTIEIDELVKQVNELAKGENEGFYFEKCRQLARMHILRSQIFHLLSLTTTNANKIKNNARSQEEFTAAYKFGKKCKETKMVDELHKRIVSINEFVVECGNANKGEILAKFFQAAILFDRGLDQLYERNYDAAIAAFDRTLLHCTLIGRVWALRAEARLAKAIALPAKEAEAELYSMVIADCSLAVEFKVSSVILFFMRGIAFVKFGQTPKGFRDLYHGMKRNILNFNKEDIVTQKSIRELAPEILLNFFSFMHEHPFANLLQHRAYDQLTMAISAWIDTTEKKSPELSDRLKTAFSWIIRIGLANNPKNQIEMLKLLKSSANYNITSLENELKNDVQLKFLWEPIAYAGNLVKFIGSPGNKQLSQLFDNLAHQIIKKLHALPKDDGLFYSRLLVDMLTPGTKTHHAAQLTYQRILQGAEEKKCENNSITETLQNFLEGIDRLDFALVAIKLKQFIEIQFPEFIRELKKNWPVGAVKQHNPLNKRVEELKPPYLVIDIIALLNEASRCKLKFNASALDTICKLFLSEQLCKAGNNSENDDIALALQFFELAVSLNRSEAITAKIEKLTNQNAPVTLTTCPSTEPKEIESTNNYANSLAENISNSAEPSLDNSQESPKKPEEKEQAVSPKSPAKKAVREKKLVSYELNTPDLKINLSPPAVAALLNLMGAGATQVYVVGGCVNEALQQKGKATDIDIVFGAENPSELIRKAFPEKKIDEENGLFKVYINDNYSLDIWHSEAMGKYAKQLSNPDLTGTEIQALKNEGLREDALTRDFTMNALYAEYKNDKIVVQAPIERSYTDLTSGKLKAINETTESFAKDPIKALRALYLMQKRELKMPDTIENAIKNMDGEKIQNFILHSPKKMNCWLRKLFCNGQGLNNFQKLRELKLLEKIFPSFKELSNHSSAYIESMLKKSDEIALQFNEVEAYNLNDSGWFTPQPNEDKKKKCKRPNFNLIYATFIHAIKKIDDEKLPKKRSRSPREIFWGELTPRQIHTEVAMDELKEQKHIAIMENHALFKVNFEAVPHLKNELLMSAIKQWNVAFVDMPVSCMQHSTMFRPVSDRESPSDTLFTTPAYNS